MAKKQRLTDAIKELHGRHGVIEDGEAFRFTEGLFTDALGKAALLETQNAAAMALLRMIAGAWILPSPPDADRTSALYWLEEEEGEDYATDIREQARKLTGWNPEGETQ